MGRGSGPKVREWLHFEPLQIAAQSWKCWVQNDPVSLCCGDADDYHRQDACGYKLKTSRTRQ